MTRRRLLCPQLQQFLRLRWAKIHSIHSLYVLIFCIFIILSNFDLLSQSGSNCLFFTILECPMMLRSKRISSEWEADEFAKTVLFVPVVLLPPPYHALITIIIIITEWCVYCNVLDVFICISLSPLSISILCSSPHLLFSQFDLCSSLFRVFLDFLSVD